MSDQDPQNPESSAPVDENKLIRARYETAARLVEAGTPVFANGFYPTHKAAAIIESEAALTEAETEVAVGGRVMIVRSFGKAGFLDLRDDSEKIQVYIKKGVVDDAGFELFAKGLDAGDVVGVRGTIFRTKHNELTIKASELRLLTKSMRPLPEKWHGLKDVEMRYRQRYVDLIANPEVRETFRARSRAISFIRRFLDERGYMEVETPMMQSIYGGAAAKPFITHHNALDMRLYLRIAPELFLKRLVVGGLEKVYEINRNFRNEGLSTRHNPEFTMLELYTAWWNYLDTMTLTEELIRATAQEVLGRTEITYQGQTIDFGAPFRRLRILDAVAEAVGIESAALRWGLASKGELETALAGATKGGEAITDGIKRSNTADEALIFLFETLVEPTLAQPTFIMDFPKSLCPLARSADGDPAVAERFELFIAALETANAYSDLNDPGEQMRRFEEQVSARQAGDEEAMSEVDRDYVRALEYGMAPASGLGIGIDRLVMLLTDSASIRDVILFPQMRAEK